MEITAVATPANQPGSSEDGTPAPAAAGGAQQPGSGVQPQNAGEPDNSSSPGNGGQEPAAGGDQGNPPAGGNEQQPQPNPEPQRFTQQEWERQQQLTQRAQARQAADTEAKELASNAPTMVRDALDTLAEELDVRIPADLRKPIIQVVENLIKHGKRGAELNYAEERSADTADVDELQGILEDTSAAFLAGLTPAERNQFAGKVRGQSPSVWVKTYEEIRTPAIEHAAIEKTTAAYASKLPEGQVRDDFLGKFKTEHDAAKLAQGFHDALLGVVGPQGEPHVAARGAGGEAFKTMREVRRAHSERRITTAELREHQARNQRGELPD